jgi:transcriptional regulator with XRE-family HTH domain
LLSFCQDADDVFALLWYNASMTTRIGHAIHQARLQAGLTQLQLATVLKVTKTNFTQLERGNYQGRLYLPTDSMMRKIIAATFAEEKRGVILAQWQWMATIDRAEKLFPGFCSRMEYYGIVIDVLQRIKTHKGGAGAPSAV